MPETTHPRQVAETSPDKLALVFADSGEQLSYRELVARADACAQLFAGAGLAEGDTVAIWLENHIRFPELCWAAKNSGLIYTCIPGGATVDDAAYIIENCDASLLVTSRALAERACEVALQLARREIQPVLLMVDGAVAPFEDYDTKLACCPSTPISGRRRGPSMLYSSGTTGRPKGIKTPLPDAPPEQPPPRLAMLKSHYLLDSDTVLVNPGPFYHAAPGRFMISLQRLGGTVVAFKKFDAERCLAAIDRYRASHGLFVPTMFIRMLALDPAVRQQYRHDSLRCVAHVGAPCPIPAKEQMIEWWGEIIGETYAGTESVGHTFITSSEWLQHKGSVGRPDANCELRIVDEQGADCPVGEPGLVYMRNGKHFEYHKDADKTQAVFLEGGWATLGDIGYLDDDGYLYLTDRQSDMIVSGGVNVYPREIENVLHTLPAIADVAVVGVPDEVFGEAVKAVVETHQPIMDNGAFEAEVLAFCRQHLAPQKCPRSVEVVEQLPRSEAGKLLKRVLRDRYWRGRGSRII